MTARPWGHCGACKKAREVVEMTHVRRRRRRQRGPGTPALGVIRLVRIELEITDLGEEVPPCPTTTTTAPRGATPAEE